MADTKEQEKERGLFGIPKSFGIAMQGMGEGFAGRGSQWRAAQAREAESEAYRQRLEADRRANLNKMLESAYAQDIYQVSQLLGGEQPRPDLVPGLIQNNIALAEQMGLQVPLRVQQMRELAEAGDFEGLRSFADTAVQAAVSSGALNLPEREGPERLSPTLVGNQVIEPTADGYVARTVEGLAEAIGADDERFSPRTFGLDDGSVLMVGSKGRSIFQTIDGRVLRGEEAAKAYEEAINAGVRIQGERAGARADATNQAGRVSETIDIGVRAARQLPTLTQTREILNEINTGGFAAAKLKAKQLLGVQGADEARLTTNLARAVLGQLRDTFGAQFTEREGQRLERIEARIGNSTDGNKAILGDLIALSEFKARQAIQAAKARGDYFAIQEINAYLERAGIDGESAPDAGVERPSGQIRILSVQ